MGFFSSLWSGVKSAAKSVAAAVVKVAKAVVRVVKELGSGAKKTAEAAARRIGAAVENIGRSMQGKTRAELERLCRNLEKMLLQLKGGARGEITDFSLFARFSVLEDLVPRLVQVVGAAKHENELSAQLRRFASEGLILLEDPSAGSDELHEAIELLSEEYLRRSVDVVALERMIIVFEGSREVEEERLHALQAAHRTAERSRAEASYWQQLGRTPRRSVAEFDQELASLADRIRLSTEQVGDLEIVTWAAEGLCQGVEEEQAAALWADELAIIQEIVFGFYLRGEDATLDVDERSRLYEAARIFRGDAASRSEEREARERVEVGV